MVKRVERGINILSSPWKTLDVLSHNLRVHGKEIKNLTKAAVTAWNASNMLVAGEDIGKVEALLLFGDESKLLFEIVPTPNMTI